jgi:hypothetical protein
MQLLGLLAILFSLIFKFRSLSNIWKIAIVKPIFKREMPQTQTTICQYPWHVLYVKFLNLLLKILCIVKLMYCESGSIISKTQHGFLGKQSTTTNLLESLNDWSKSLENKQFVKILYVDYEKAFDKISVPKLLHKLKCIGVSGLLFDYLSSFLSNRYQSVRVGNVLLSLSVWSAECLKGNSKGGYDLVDRELVIGDSTLCCLTSVRDLGIVIDPRLTLRSRLVILFLRQNNASIYYLKLLVVIMLT